MILQSASRKPPTYKLFRSVIPGWDNTPRRQDTSTVIINSQPDLYGAWLTYLRAYSRKVHPDEKSRFIFINAWNEWGEGCYLEPDLRWGLGYLDETYRSKFYEGDAAGDLDISRATLVKTIAEIKMSANGLTSADNNSRRLIERKLANYSVPNPVVWRVATALARWPTVRKMAKFVFKKTYRLWAQR